MSAVAEGPAIGWSPEWTATGRQARITATELDRAMVVIEWEEAAVRQCVMRARITPVWRHRDRMRNRWWRPIARARAWADWEYLFGLYQGASDAMHSAHLDLIKLGAFILSDGETVSLTDGRSTTVPELVTESARVLISANPENAQAIIKWRDEALVRVEQVRNANARMDADSRRRLEEDLA